jgi:LPXTG-motif cell wall-anchored protein
VLSVSVVLSTVLGDAVTASLDLFPLRSSATAPAGGVECPLPAPVITSPADGDWTTPTPTITGTGEPGATVNVSVDGTPIGTTTVAGDGSWNLPVTTALAPGAHDAVATQTVGAMTSPESNNPTFNVAAAPVITAPADGSSTTDRTPDIDGTGEPGAQVEVFVDGDSIGTTTVAPDGTWTITPSAPLDLGEHTVDATQTDLGQLTQDAEPVTFEVIDSLAPPVITAPEDGSSTDDTTPDIDGEGAPGATVEVTIDDEVVGTTVVDEDGTWTLELADELSCGEHTVTATQARGGLASAASAPVTFTVTCAQGGPDSGEPTTTPTATSLPDTGSPSGMAAVALIGLGLLGAGALLLRRLHA